MVVKAFAMVTLGVVLSVFLAAVCKCCMGCIRIEMDDKNNHFNGLIGKIGGIKKTTCNKWFYVHRNATSYLRFAFFVVFAAFFSLGVNTASFLTFFFASCDFAMVIILIYTFNTIRKRAFPSSKCAMALLTSAMVNSSTVG